MTKFSANMMKFFIIATVLISMGNCLSAQDKLLDIMQNELGREFTELKKQETPPYFMSYRISEIYKITISASFGSIVTSETNKERILLTEIRVGNNKVDNSHEIRDDSPFGALDRFTASVKMPLDNEPDAIKQALWKATNETYRNVVDKYAKVKANLERKVAEEDKSEDFTIETPNVYYEEPAFSELDKFDVKKWEEKLKKYSEIFLTEPDIFSGNASISFVIERKYYVSTEGSKIAENYKAARLFVSGTTKSTDGMVMPLYESYFAFSPDKLPTDDKIMKDVNNVVKILKGLKDAPLVDPYTGPALMTGKASGVFFHEIFGHRIEGQRMKSESDGQTFKKKIGEKILNENLSVVMDPTMQNYNGQDLNGYYKYDDQGVKSEKVDIVNNGILKGFLMSRRPIEGFPKSNGHGRAQAGMEPVTRQSNLIVTTNKQYTFDELKQILRDEAKKQGLDYAYLFSNVVGGFTMTGRFIPNAFNVTPTEVYRIYVDGRPDELVRGVDLVGTPLSMFSQIEAGGGDIEVFTGTCGAESGGVPVTAISPAIFVKRIEMQKKDKSQERPPILPRPGVKPDKN
jgi:TldD protein